ncbi:hypothetical protein KBB25_00745 [Candidatus Gracilibacteria bacterium]|nr:hypothetical protein [Candidatus Gracilibacteria bacterium]
MKNILDTTSPNLDGTSNGSQYLIQQSAGNLIDILSTQCIQGKYPGVSCYCSSCLQPGNKVKSHQPTGPSSHAQYGNGYEVSDLANLITRKNTQMG